MNVKCCLHELLEDLEDLSLFIHPLFFLNNLFWFTLVLFFSFLGFVCFVNATLNNLKFSAIFNQRDSRINFSAEWQNIVNHWDIPSKLSRKCQKMVTKIARLDQWEMFGKVSPRDQLVCLAGFVGMEPLACLACTSCFPSKALFRFLLPLPTSFLRVCRPLIFADLLKFFPSLTNYVISGAAKSNKSEPKRFAARATHFFKI